MDGEISVSVFVSVLEIIKQQFKLACILQTRVILVRHKQRNLERKTLSHFLNPKVESTR